MTQSTCHHCGYDFDDALTKCPNCETPAPHHDDTDTAARSKRFVAFFVVLVIFCLLMVFMLPRDI